MRAETFAKEFANDELITPSLAPHSVYTLDAKTLTATSELAKRLNIPIQHESSSRYSGTDTDVIFWTRGGIPSGLPEVAVDLLDFDLGNAVRPSLRLARSDELGADTKPTHALSRPSNTHAPGVRGARLCR